MKILDLFCGTKSVANVFEEMGHEVVTLDFDEQFKPTIYADILTVTAEQLQALGPFDMVWASPPCECFSVASIGAHWTGGKRAYEPKDDNARTAISIVRHTMNLIWELNPEFYFVENPRGLLRKMPVMNGYYRTTVWYCQYGDDRAKPTDIWGRFPKAFVARTCKNYTQDEISGKVPKHCHHAVAQRGARTGTQGRSNALERARIPRQLIIEILEAYEREKEC